MSSSSRTTRFSRSCSRRTPRRNHQTRCNRSTSARKCGRILGEKLLANGVDVLGCSTSRIGFREILGERDLVASKLVAEAAYISDVWHVLHVTGTMCNLHQILRVSKRQAGTPGPQFPCQSLTCVLYLPWGARCYEHIITSQYPHSRDHPPLRGSCVTP